MTNSDRMVRLNDWRDARLSEIIDSGVTDLELQLDELKRLYDEEAHCIRRAMRKAQFTDVAANDV